jgi:hypothetical protein
MINGILGQTPAIAPGAANSGYAYGDGIRFEDEVWTPEEQELEVIKRKILEKLMVRLGPDSISRTFPKPPALHRK